MAHQRSQSPIRKLLVANRGEIATRILNTARELSIETYALATPSDYTHTLHATHILSLESPAAYLQIDTLLSLVKKHSITHIHPGYGFLSESPTFAQRAQEECNATVIGPGPDILERTGDKLAARLLADECTVPVLPAMTTPTASVDDIAAFADKAGYPVMLKAVDGGGGRGIRLVRSVADLHTQARVAIAESPSRRIFAERAAVDGFRHIEIQIIGDGMGAVRHLWERECSVQRRDQKIVEFAPALPAAGTASETGRRLVKEVIEAAVRMAERIRYKSLGTFEFLANPATSEFFFLEVNPRLQVEHTVTEQVCRGLDLVSLQLRIAAGARLDDLVELSLLERNPLQPPQGCSIQLRVTAENTSTNWSLSVGTISAFAMPSGNGIRVDTALHGLAHTTISADFDSLVAKIIVTAPTWKASVAKARRALEDTRIDGVKTNLEVLRAIVAHDDFKNGRCDTSWLETRLGDLEETLTDEQQRLQQVEQRLQESSASEKSTSTLSGSSSSTVVLRKGDGWSIKLGSPATANSTNSATDEETHHLKLLHLARNEFPNLLSATIAYATSSNPEPKPVSVTISSTRASASAVAGTSGQRRGDPSDPHHVVIPFAGKLVEVCVDEGDYVKAGDVICVVSQMKMELTICAGQAGRVTWVLETADGEDVGEGTLAAELDLNDGRKARL